jgi:hypothetical protein
MYKDSWRVKFDEEKREEGYIFVDTKYFVFLPPRNTFFWRKVGRDGTWKWMDTILKKDGRGNTLCTSVVCTWWRMYNLHLKEFTSAIIKVAEYVNLYMIKSRRMSRRSVHDKSRRMRIRVYRLICNQIFKIETIFKIYVQYPIQ